MARTEALQSGESSGGSQVRVVQEVLLTLLAGEGSYGYQLRAQLQLSLGPLGDSLNAGHLYVTLGRLEKAGLITSSRVKQSDRPDRKAYELTEAGQQRVESWLADTSWPKAAPAEFHLKLVAAASAALADPVRLVDRQRRALFEELAVAQRAALGEAEGSVAGLLLEGTVLRLQADLRWLEECARFWSRP